MNINLHEVTLDKTDSCLTYVLKRRGIFNLYPFGYDDLIAGQMFEVLAYRGELRIGDILLWNKELEIKPMSIKITVDGKLIFCPVWQGFHCAVYEGDGLISDCTRDMYFYPYIRVRYIHALSPDLILRWRMD